ncbi:16S rRNA (guanine527-N7)-methyltransferase [Ferrithrix thermotolerans DSM 19514]|uniref:Glucose-inhibited division protein B n=1 Tax=Ferrithrix thermotolerans DSM 19514 TaxID=1121881 RepID=A0A1M4XTB8_9ACTN|nr:RsmG family class I SAM-dependent methyltransferase [Ferrithrix thermotolerans]SHE96739.1 16S rRNA (guanine527-N7)-methyltransferase [Ferrithrix thermotolerans DSM 19514]
MDSRFDWVIQSQSYGFLGPSAPKIHLEQALFFCDTISDLSDKVTKGKGLRLADLGTGGGFPGLVIAQVLDYLQVVLIESMQKRAKFLEDVIRSYGLTERCSVVSERAEILGNDPDFREAFDFVTAKAFGRPGVTAECGSGLVSVGGFLVVSDPPSVDQRDRRWPDRELASLGLRYSDKLQAPFALSVMTKTRKLSKCYPRNTQRLMKEPLF